MENKKDFKILCVGEGGEGKKKIEYDYNTFKVHTK